jgi:hypothetical protein
VPLIFQIAATLPRFALGNRKSAKDGKVSVNPFPATHQSSDSATRRVSVRLPQRNTEDILRSVENVACRNSSISGEKKQGVKYAEAANVTGMR